MLPSDQVPPGVDWISRRLTDLERQMRELQAGRRLEAATIGAGGLTVKGGSIRVLDGGGTEVMRIGALPDGRHGLIAADAAGGSVELAQDAVRVRDTAGRAIVELGKAADSRYGLRVNDTAGDPQIRAGELAGGGYGLEAVDAAGKLVKLSTLAFGPKAHYMAGDALVTSTSFVNATPGANAGPTVSGVVIGDTGRCIVTLGSSMIVNDEAGYMGVDISGPTNVVPFLGFALIYDNRFHIDADSSAIGASKTFIVDGLAAGSYTFQARYATASGNQVNFYDRHLIVQPF